MVLGPKLLCWELKVAACAGLRGKGPEHFAGFILAEQVSSVLQHGVRCAEPAHPALYLVQQVVLGPAGTVTLWVYCGENINIDRCLCIDL